MSKKLLYLLGILLTIIVGTILHWLFSCDCADRSGNKGIAGSDKTIVTIPIEKTTDSGTAVSDTSELKNWMAVKERLNVNPLTLYFRINRTDVSMNREETLKLEEILDYLNNVTDAALTVTGHTDILGDRNDNIRLGQKRADAVKTYLLQRGAAESKITCTSKGPDEPVDDNQTSQGRAKNRRAVILIK
jgi:outer membrane protein OmpA-like peptidoglycan-associated protein